MKYFEVFKAGNYPQGTFTQDQIAALAANYDPEFSEAPITLDHEQKGPAFGWVSGLKCDNGKLKASFRDISPELKEYVKSGKYKKISVEIFRNLDGKVPYLKAISFLGAITPQVKGLEAVEFRDAEADVFIFEHEPEPGDSIAEPGENITFEEIKPSPEITKMQQKVEDLEKQVKIFAENNEASELISGIQTQISKMSEQLVGLSDDSVARQKAEQELARLRLQMRRNEFESYVNEQIAFGNLTPAQKELSLKMLMALDSVPHFENDAEPVAVFKNFVETLPKQVTLGEIATIDTAQETNANISVFENASEESVEIFKAAKELAAKDGIDFRDALLKINQD